MSGYLCFQIELTRGYDYSSFREDLKKLYTSAGVEGKNTVFLFTDTQVPTSVECQRYECVHILSATRRAVTK